MISIFTGSSFGYSSIACLHSSFTSNVISSSAISCCPAQKPCSDPCPKNTITACSAFLARIPSGRRKKSLMNVLICSLLLTSRHVIVFSRQAASKCSTGNACRQKFLISSLCSRWLSESPISGALISKHW